MGNEGTTSTNCSETFVQAALLFGWVVCLGGLPLHDASPERARPWSQQRHSWRDLNGLLLPPHIASNTSPYLEKGGVLSGIGMCKFSVS